VGHVLLRAPDDFVLSGIGMQDSLKQTVSHEGCAETSESAFAKKDKPLKVNEMRVLAKRYSKYCVLFAGLRWLQTLELLNLRS